jgi:sugar phosphate isomerase/epimerase
MLKGLAPGAVGVSVSSLEDRVRAARDFGFDAVEIDPAEVVRRGPAECLAVLGGVKPAGWGLPTAWRGDDDAYRRDLEALPALAEAAASIGCTRTFTWILPGSNDRPLEENRAFHIERFRPIAAILERHGCRFGLEFIGPKTMRDTFKHPFLYRMEDMLAMAREIGPNVGLLLDCWHWYTSGGTVQDLHRLTANDVVYVHVNDAPAGVPMDAQVDNVRCLPGETGVIPIEPFMHALRAMGYDGAVVPEPFKAELAELPSDEARLRVVADSLDRIFEAATA